MGKEGRGSGEKGRSFKGENAGKVEEWGKRMEDDAVDVRLSKMHLGCVDFMIVEADEKQKAEMAPWH